MAVPSGLTMSIFATNFRLALSSIEAPAGALSIQAPDSIHATCVPFICRFAMRPCQIWDLPADPAVVAAVTLGLTVTFVPTELLVVEFVDRVFVEFNIELLVDVLFPPSVAKLLSGMASATKENARAAATTIATVTLELLPLGNILIDSMVAPTYLGHL